MRVAEPSWAMQLDDTASPPLHHTKYVFLIRHAQSEWNQALRGLKTCAFASVLSQGGLIAQLDHGLSDTGRQQAKSLRRTSSDLTLRDADAGRDKQFYEAFQRAKSSVVYCSPMRRALQTAKEVCHKEDGWPLIKLIRDAREIRHSVFEIDCASQVGNVGRQIALSAGFDASDAQDRVDVTDCETQWWTEISDSEEDADCRVRALWQRVTAEEGDACVVVTHSNLIIKLAQIIAGDLATELGVAEHEGDGNFRILSNAPGDLQQARLAKLENCGVLGLRCTKSRNGAGCVSELDFRWVVEDALLMFGSEFEESSAMPPLQESASSALDLELAAVASVSAGAYAEILEVVVDAPDAGASSSVGAEISEPNLRLILKEWLTVMSNATPPNLVYKPGTYRELRKTSISISGDLHRTGLAHFGSARSTDPQKRLENLLCAYAACDPEVGYCQELCVVASRILYMAGTERDQDEEDAFRVLFCMMQITGFRRLFLHNYALADRYVLQVKTYMEAEEQQVYRAIVEDEELFFQAGGSVWRWMVTLFACFFEDGTSELPALSQFWDVIIARGIDALPRLAVLVLKQHASFGSLGRMRAANLNWRNLVQQRLDDIRLPSPTDSGTMALVATAAVLVGVSACMAVAATSAVASTAAAAGSGTAASTAASASAASSLPLVQAAAPALALPAVSALSAARSSVAWRRFAAQLGELADDACGAARGAGQRIAAPFEELGTDAVSAVRSMLSGTDPPRALTLGDAQ